MDYVCIICENGYASTCVNSINLIWRYIIKLGYYDHMPVLIECKCICNLCLHVYNHIGTNELNSAWFRNKANHKIELCEDLHNYFSQISMK